MEPYISELIHFGISIIILWLLVYHLIPDFRLDALRERLFSIRDNVFDLAADGKIDFQHPAYRAVRHNLNCLIRFADRLNLISVLLGLIFINHKRLKKSKTTLLDEMPALAADLPKEVRQQLFGATFAAYFVAVDYLFLGLLSVLVRIRMQRTTPALPKKAHSLARVIDREAGAFTPCQTPNSIA